MSEKFQAGEAVMTFTGDDKQFQATADRVESTMKQVASGMDKGAESVEGFIVNVRQFTILTQVASGLRKVGDEAAKMSADFQQGKVSVGDMIEKFSEAIPIIGSFITLGRGIHELVTGEQAYTEVLKQQTAEQEKRIELTERLVAGIRKLGREQEDLQARLDRHPGDSDFFAKAQGIFLSGERSGQDIKDKIERETKPLLKAVEKEKEALGKELFALTSTVNTVNQTTASPEESFAKIGELRTKLDGLESQAQKYREAIAGVDKALQETAKRGFFTQITGLVGGEIVGAMGKAGAAVEAFIRKNSQLQPQTEAALRAMGGAWEKYRTDVNAIQADLTKGLIGQGTASRAISEAFAQNFKVSLDQIPAKITGLLSNLKSQFEEAAVDAGRHIDAAAEGLRSAELARLDAAAKLGNEEARQAAARLRIEDEVAKKRRDLTAISLDPKALEFQRAAAKVELGKLPQLQSDLVSGIKLPKIDAPKGFSASLLGLTQLHDRIQTGAGSLSGNEQQIELAKKQLETQKSVDKHVESAGTAIKELKAAFEKGNGRPAIVG